MASRWLLAIAFAAAFSLVVPALAAAAEGTVIDAPASAEPAVPAGEVTPTGDATAEPTTPATPPESPGGTVTEPATDGGASELPAPPPSEAPVNEAPVPGAEATPTPAPSPVAETPVASTPLPVIPDDPSTPTTWTPDATTPQAPADRLAATSTVPAVSVTPTAPDSPGALSGPADAAPAHKAPVAPITDFVASVLNPAGVTSAESGAITQVGGAPVAPDSASLPGFDDEVTVDLSAPHLVAPVGSAPAGSSLLAVLAGYVLPGSSGPPASMLVMLIVIGLILGIGYAARPQMTEALASAHLMGASCGHAMAVRRPG